MLFDRVRLHRWKLSRQRRRERNTGDNPQHHTYENYELSLNKLFPSFSLSWQCGPKSQVSTQNNPCCLSFLYRDTGDNVARCIWHDAYGPCAPLRHQVLNFTFHYFPRLHCRCSRCLNGTRCLHLAQRLFSIFSMPFSIFITVSGF
jgi:hypothetical protein